MMWLLPSAFSAWYLRRQPVSRQVLNGVVVAALAVSLGYLTMNAPFDKSVSTVGVTMTGLMYIPKALSIVSEEHDRARAERDAFEAFKRRLSDIEPCLRHSTTQSAHSLGSELASAPHSPGAQLQRVQQAYRETVMAVAHYEEDYGQSLAADLREEFTDEIAIAVTTGEQFTPHLKTAVQQHATNAQTERTQLLQDIEDEQTGLEQAKQTMGPITDALQAFDESLLVNQSFPALQDQYERFCEYEEQCTAVVEQRQQHHHETPRQWPNGEVGDLQWYLYADLPVQYPVLADGATLINQLEAAQQTIAVSLGKING